MRALPIPRLAALGLACCTAACSEVVVLDPEGRGDSAGSSGADGGGGALDAPNGACPAVDADVVLLDGGAIDVFGAAAGPACETWIAGAYAGDLALPGGAQAPHAGNWDGFVARVDDRGRATSFVRVAGKADSWADRVDRVVVDGAGRAYVAGDVDDELWIDGSLVLATGGNFVAAFGADGELRWVTPVGFAPADLTLAGGALVALGSSGSALSRASIDVESGLVSTSELGAGAIHVLAAASSSVGSALLLRCFGDVTIGGSTLSTHDSAPEAGTSDLLVAGVLPTGQVGWTRGFDEQAFEANVGRIAIDDHGTASFFVGFNGQVTIDGEVSAAPSDGQMSLLAARIYDGGFVQQSHGLGHAVLMAPLWAAADADGSVAWAAMVHDGEVGFGDQTLVVDAFPGAGFRARIDDVGIDDWMQPLDELEAVEGTARAPLVFARLRDPGGQDLGVRLVRHPPP